MTWNILGFSIAPYGTMIAAGFLAGIIVGILLSKKCGYLWEDFLITGIYGMVFGFLGAKLLYILLNIREIDWKAVFQSPGQVSELISGGFVFYGGLILGLAALYLPYRIHRIPSLKIAEGCIAAVPLAHGFGRIGCFFAGCCYGIPYDGPLHITYHMPSFAPDGIPLFPVQLAEAAMNFIIAAFLVVRTVKKGARFSNLLWYLLLYSTGRFVLEYFRSDPERKFLLFFSTSQWISLGIFLVCGILLLVQLRKPESERL